MKLIENWIHRNFLLVLFVFATALLGMLVFEQDRTIASQRTLIRSLLADSLELSESKMRELREERTR